MVASCRAQTLFILNSRERYDNLFFLFLHAFRLRDCLKFNVKIDQLFYFIQNICEVFILFKFRTFERSRIKLMLKQLLGFNDFKGNNICKVFFNIKFCFINRFNDFIIFWHAQFDRF